MGNSMMQKEDPTFSMARALLNNARREFAMEEEAKRKILTVGWTGSRKICFFCNGDTFHLNMDNSFQCSACGSIFFKGPVK